jgi:hypothetical protein
VIIDLNEFDSQLNPKGKGHRGGKGGNTGSQKAEVSYSESLVTSTNDFIKNIKVLI